MSEGMPQGINRTVASLVRMLARSFNDLYLMFSCTVVHQRRATGDVVSLYTVAANKRLMFHLRSMIILT